jgi:hypothetical protein
VDAVVHQARQRKGSIQCPAAPPLSIHYSNQSRAQGDNWNDLLKEVITFESVEEFWGVYVRQAARLFPDRLVSV